MSKTQQKMALVAKRLAMLHNSSINSVSEETPLQCSIQPIKTERMSSKRKLNTCNDVSDHETKCGDYVKSENLEMVCKLEEPLDNNTSEEKFMSAMDRAKEVQANLSGAYPSFVKMLLPSHVSGCFWMHMPRKFCNENLPKEDCDVMLVDEAGLEFKTKYLVPRGLSGGWRGFAIHHHLQKADVLIFHLVRPTTFKVYIIRDQRYGEVDGALGLLESDTCARQIIPGCSQHYIAGDQRQDDGSLGLLESDTCARQMITEKAGETVQMVLHTEDNPPIESPSPSNTDNDSQPEVLDGIRFSDSDINFEAITGFENFNIIVDGLVIDSKFSPANLRKYYELCHSQNNFLHQSLLKGLNCNLVVGIILETINIADAIRACKSSTSMEDLQTWKTTLDGFKLLGMKVSFLCAKLNLLLGIADESNVSKTCTFERTTASKRLRALEDKIMDLKGVMEKIDSEIEAEMTASVRKHESKIKEIANTPW
ncbi:hypothetical protein vseg_010979 [Gypsophila vaccaria]